MALVHCYIAHHTHGQNNGGGARAARYLERDGEYTALDATNVTTYNQRTSDRTKDYGDLTYRNVANLPSWAQDNPQIFFETAYRNEGKNRRWGTSMQTNFPRQFSHDHQVAMLNAFVETHLPNRPTLFVIHEPGASDGLPQPHTHILWSERLMHDGKPERGPEVMFKRPEAGGAWKYASGKGDLPIRYIFS